MRVHSNPVKIHAMKDERIDRRTAFGRLGVGAVLIASNRPTTPTPSRVAPLPDRFRRVVLRLDPDPVDLEASLRYLFILPITIIVAYAPQAERDEEPTHEFDFLLRNLSENQGFLATI